MRTYQKVIILCLQVLFITNAFSQVIENDWQFIPNGTLIHSDGYVDQPYISILNNDTWFCVYTTSQEHEGSKGQHIACRTSTDQGKTWSKAIRIEEPGMESKSWGIPYVTDYGRIYVFYSYNGDKIHDLGERKNIREDMLGWYCFKYSDDNGKKWSERYRIPMRKTAIDRMNQWNGEVQIFWGIDKPKKIANGCMFAFTKVGEYMLEYSDGWIFHCDNIEVEKDAKKLRWKLLPDGDYGIRSPEWGDIQEEHNTVHMHNGTIYCVYRTTQGFPLVSCSYDKGHSWTEPTPPVDYNGRALKNPRANPKIWKCENGRYLLWYHHNSTRGFYNRNPAWISGGIEKEGKIIWTQPEILLYEKDLVRGPSYPDLVEQDGKYWITETQKTEARIHQIPNDFLNTLWSQVDLCEPSTGNLSIDLSGESLSHADSVKLPDLLPMASSDGFTLTVRLRSNLDMANGKIIVDSRDGNGKGFWLQASENNSVMLSVSDGDKSSSWKSDPGILQTRSRKNQEVTVIVDYGSRIIQFITDGVVNDGKDSPFGWGRYNEAIEDISSDWLRIDKTRKTITGVKFYDRPLMNSEVIGEYRYWMQQLNK